MYLTFYLAKRQELPTLRGNIYFFLSQKELVKSLDARRGQVKKDIKAD